MSDHVTTHPVKEPHSGQWHEESTKPESSFAAPAGSVTPDALIVAFVQGAQWWEYHKTGATMWASDRDQAEDEAKKRTTNGTLGKSPNI